MTFLLPICWKIMLITSIFCARFTLSETSQQTETKDYGSSMKMESIDTPTDKHFDMSSVLGNTRWYMWNSDRWSAEEEPLLKKNITIENDQLALGFQNTSHYIQIVDPHELYNNLWTHFHQSILRYFSNSTPFELELEFSDYEEYLTASKISPDDLDLEYEKHNLEGSRSSSNAPLPTHDIFIPHRPPETIDKNNISKILHRFFQPFLAPYGQYPSWENIPKEQKSIYLSQELGHPQRYSDATVMSLVVYYGGLLLLGIPGNLLTCLIILTNPYMRTAPNIYLLNLAVVDLVTLTMSKYLSI